MITDISTILLPKSSPVLLPRTGMYIFGANASYLDLFTSRKILSVNERLRQVFRAVLLLSVCLEKEMLIPQQNIKKRGIFHGGILRPQ